MRASQLQRRLLRAAGQAIADFQLVTPGDRIMVAISGGKDSATLLDLLRLLQRRAPVPFELAAAHVDAGYPGDQASVVAAFCAAQDVPFFPRAAPVYQMVQEKIAPGKTACALCSRIRRGCLYTLCRREGYNKLALGHHLDDAIETLLLNLFYAGSLRGMPARLDRDQPPHVIRPLCYALERDIAMYAKTHCLPTIRCASPTCGDADGRRATIKRLLATLEADHPDIKTHARRALRGADLSPAHLGQPALEAVMRGVKGA